MLVVVSFFCNAALEIGSLMRKSAIQQTVGGFEEVNQHVKNALVDWIGSAVRRQFQELVDDAVFMV